MLRRANRSDAKAIHRLLCEPLVYQYLCDGVRPPPTVVDDWLGLNQPAVGHPTGVWLLEHSPEVVAGCVSLKDAQQPQTAELTYFLSPTFWGQGLALRISWTVIDRAFRHGLQRVIAGADGPNHRSIKVMQRLGMRYARSVTYPLGPGVEYERLAGDPIPRPLPALVAFQAH